MLMSCCVSFGHGNFLQFHLANRAFTGLSVSFFTFALHRAGVFFFAYGVCVATGGILFSFVSRTGHGYEQQGSNNDLVHTIEV